MVIAVGIWSVLTPPSWFMGGPVYLVIQLLYRLSVYSGQSADIGGPAGFFLPTRYLWPFELAILLVLATLALGLWRRWLRIRHDAGNGLEHLVPEFHRHGRGGDANQHRDV